MASLVLSGDTSGSITVSAPAVAGSNTQTLPAVSGTILVQGTASNIVSGTAVTASSAAVSFTGIPSWAKKITVIFDGVSTNGTSPYQVQIGDAGGLEITGYVGNTSETAAGAAGSTVYAGAGFTVTRTTAAASLTSGYLTLVNVSGNTWVGASVLAAAAATTTYYGAGSKSLSDVLTQVSITTVGGANTFDAGTINIMWE